MGNLWGYDVVPDKDMWQDIKDYAVGILAILSIIAILSFAIVGVLYAIGVI